MTTTTTTARKQTAGNNAFLADCKHWFNKPIYARMLAMVNDPTQGREAAEAYLLKNVVRDLSRLSERVY